MTPENISAINEHALQAYPGEACGLVVVIKGRERYVPCRNLAEKPTEHFRLSPDDYADADDAGEITHIVHSHPDVPSRPSEGDRVSCEASRLPWYIVSVMPDAQGLPSIAGNTILSPTGYKAPLVGRQFHHGTLDCWSLCRDWYRTEWGISLPNPQRRDGWWDDGKSNLYLDNLANAGFRIAQNSQDELQKGDLILMSVRSKNLVPNHAGVYIGDGLMIHHMYGRLSSRDVYGGYWHTVTTHVARHATSIGKTHE